jgi:branched-chain amino acid transport system substrate-binding protein
MEAAVMQRSTLRVAAMILSLEVVAIVNGASSAADEPYVINTVLSLTGPGAFLGMAEQTTLAALETRVNGRGGINGRPIHFAIQDDGSTPQNAVQLVNELLAKEVPVVLGPTLNGACGAVAPLFKDGPVDFCLSGGFQPQPYGYVFNYGPGSADYVDTNVRYFRELGYTKIAFLSTADVSGQDSEQAFDAALREPENKSLVVVAREHFNVSDQTVAAQIARIKASGAQALFTWGTGTPMGTVFRAVKDTGLDIPMSISAPNLVNAEMQQYASILPDKMVVPGMAFMVPNSLQRGPLKSAVLDFISTIEKATGQPADIGYSIAWDPGLIIISAFKKLGFNATPQQLHDYLANLHDLAGANGIYDFRNGNNRGMGRGSAIMIRWVPATRSWGAASRFGGVPLRTSGG